MFVSQRYVRMFFRIWHDILLPSWAIYTWNLLSMLCLADIFADEKLAKPSKCRWANWLRYGQSLIECKDIVMVSLSLFPPIYSLFPYSPTLTPPIHPICTVYVRYRSLMDLQQVCPSPSSSAIPSVPKVRSYFHHISNTPLFVPVPLVSPFVPMFPVSLISISMPLWSSRLSHSFLPPIPVFPCFMLVPFVSSPWPSQANPGA